MEEMKLDNPIRVVKKNTYNSIINKAHLNINPENSPIKKMIISRSHSFKKITKFVPVLQPKKSTFVPKPLKLNKEKKELNKEKEQLSEDEIEIIDNDSSCSSITSSQFDSSDENIQKEKEKIKQMKSIPIIKNSSYNLLDNIESKDIEEETDYDIYLTENKENIEKINKLRLIRRKLWQIKAKAIINKYKETEEVIHDNFKNIYNFGLDDIEIDDEPNNNLHGSVNIFEFRRINNTSINQKPKTIFEVLSVSKESIKK